MKNDRSLSVLFGVAAAYDGILGLAFLLAPAALFESLKVTPPNHFGYVQFPAALLLVFALMFLAIAKNPRRNKNLVPFGILLKVSYCTVVFYHWFGAGIPYIWKPFAVCDLVFIALFVAAYVALSKDAPVDP